MKTYKDYIKEDAYDDEVRNNKARKLYPESMNLYSVIRNFVNTSLDKRSYSDLQYKLFDGKDISGDIKRYTSVAKSLEDISKNFKDTIYNKDYENTNKLLKDFYMLVERYKKLEDMFKQIYSYLKVGESVDKSLPKVSEMTKKVKFYSLELGKYGNAFFDYYSVDDLKLQMKDHKDAVKLNGESNLYIQYKNGKLYGHFFG